MLVVFLILIYLMVHNPGLMVFLIVILVIRIEDMDSRMDGVLESCMELSSYIDRLADEIAALARQRAV